MARFNDSIAVTEIADGMLATIANMEALVGAARTLVEAGSFGPAFGLSIMSLEEAGKLHALRAMCQRGGIPGAKWRQLWASFRSHNYKSSGGLMDCYSDEVRGDPETILELALQHEAAAGQVEDARQWSFYVDFDGESRAWNRPHEFSRQKAHETLSLAETALQRAQNHRDAGLCSVEALEVMRAVYEPFWSELLASTQPVSATEIAKRAVPYHQEFYRRIADEGILDPLSGVEPLV